MHNQYGTELYKDVLILWDEDHDERIRTFINDLQENERDDLVMCGESEGDLTLWWRNQIPQSFQSKESITVEDDYWNIHQQYHWVGR